MREEPGQRRLVRSVEVRVSLYRRLHLVLPAVAAEERKPLGAVEERRLLDHRLARRDLTPEAGSERQPGEGAREERLAGLHEEVRPPRTIHEGFALDAAVAA